VRTRRGESDVARENRELRQTLADIRENKVCSLCRTRRYQIEQLPHQGCVLGAPNLTVVIPTIKIREKLLHRATRSCQRQLLKPRFIMPVRDDSRNGAGLTRKRGLTEVKTPYVAFMDDDDEMNDNHLFVLMNELVASDADRIYSCHTDCLTPDEDECAYCRVSTFVGSTRRVSDSVVVKKASLRTWVKHTHDGQTGGKL